MKIKKFKIHNDYEVDEYEMEARRKTKADLQNSRRPVKNWKKAWSQHTDDYDERDEFYGKKMSIR